MPQRPSFGASRLPKLPTEQRTLAGAVGGLPVPPRLAKPPAPRVAKPAAASLFRLAAAKPRALLAAKPASSVAKRQSVAGRLGAFVVTPLKSAPPPSGLTKPRR
jgi:hypothetical protein